MSSLHGQYLSINKVTQLNNLKLSRNQFLDFDLKTKISKKVATKDELLFLGNDIAEPNKKQPYQLIIHGILPCGSKTTLSINGIKPYVDVRLVPTESENAAKSRITKLIESINEDNVFATNIDIKKGKDFLYFDHEKHRYARVYFKSLQARTAFLELCIEEDIKTYSNDKSCYYRVVARDYEINLSGWNVLKNYSRSFGGTSKAEYLININISDIKPILNDDILNQTAIAHGLNQSIVRYENLIMSSFDIEMIPDKPDRFPDADKNPKDSIFMICMTYHFVKRSDAILSVCLTLKKTQPIDNVLIIHCQSEACLLLAFAQFMSYMQPDFITEFNGGGFDWRNIITKARHCGVLNAFLENMSLVRLSSWEFNTKMLSRFHREIRIKISGATAESICKGLKMQGFVAFDTLIVFKQLEPNADSHKLNECLRRCNLGSKDDLDVKEMFRIYRSGTSEEMSTVAHYCYIDTFKLQQLLIKKNVVQDRREVANLSYTSLQDNFYFAGGSRMRNLLMNRGNKLGYFFDTQYRPEIEDPDAKFPGAYVVPPIKGIVKPILRLDEYLIINKIKYDDNQLNEGYKFIKTNFEQIYHSDENFNSMDAPEFIKSYIEYTNSNKNQYPISGLDFASLYPSIIMTYNISPEKLVIDEGYANRLKEMGYDIQYVQFAFCNKIMRAWFVRHNNVEDDYSICGQLLIELFARRAAIKKNLKHYGEKIYEMEMEMKPFIEEDNLYNYPRLAEYNETKFDYVSADSKQKAVKVFMNTLYGEMGNFLSCICAIQVAASVTTMGRYNLKLAKNFVEDNLKMKVYYGDTDSLYVACNPTHFIQYDEEYFTGVVDKLTYSSHLVEETFKQIETAKTLVNKHLQKDNGSKFLKMAYEEVLYPAAFLSKKKYYGIPHEENVDFYPRKLFLRGLEIVKRGASAVLKDVINGVLREVMDIKNTRDIIDIIKDSIALVFNTNWPIDAFAKTKAYRPDKNNISVKTMIDRYRFMNYHTIPEPNVRFKYVICKYYPWTYDIQGRIESKMSIGDRMELVERVIEEGLEIDLEYYFDNELTGQFARLITFCEQFNGVVNEIEDCDQSQMSEIEIEAINKENYQRIEDTLFKAAKKFIGLLAKQYSKAYVNKGSLYANTWREVCNFIAARPDIQLYHFNAVTIKLFHMFNNSTGNICQDLTKWSVEFLGIKYGKQLTSEQQQQLSNQLQSVENYICEKELDKILIGWMDKWKKQIVSFIRNEYDYDFICKHDLPYHTIWDVLDRHEMEIILKDKTLFPSISTDHAMEIIDMIIMIISQYISVE